MHIVLDCRCIHCHMGGIGRVALGLAEYLAKSPRNHRFTILLGMDTPPNLQIDGAELIQVEAAMIDERFEQVGLPCVLEELGADLYINTTFSIPALKTTKYQLTIIHDVVFEDNPEWVEESLRTYLQHWSRFSSVHADRVITVSDHAKSRISSVYGVDASRIQRIYNGLPPLEFILPPDDSIAKVRDKYGLNASYILYIGTMEPKKGVPELLAAFSVLARSGFAGDLVLAGGKGGPAFNLEAAMAQTMCLDRIRHLGYVSDSEKKPLLAGSELFVYPSHYEGFGLPPLEAMALGVPCLVNRATSLPEVVGDVAQTVDIKDREAFVAALKKGLQDKKFRSRAHKAGPAWARRFSWETSAGQYIDLFESLGAA